MIYRPTRSAKADIQENYRYTSREFGIGQAELYLGGLDYTFDLLTDNPRMGKKLPIGVFRYLYRKHLVFYRIKGQEIIVLRIWNTNRQLPADWR